MSRPWTFDDDQFLAAYFDAVGDICGWHDLGRPEGAASKRVARLKATGAWDALKAHIKADYENKRQYLLCLGKTADVRTIDEMHVGAPDHFDAELAAIARAEDSHV